MVRGETDRVAAARYGTRNHTLFAAAARLGEFVGAGALSPTEATTALLYAGLFCLTHVVTSILLGALLRFLLVKFGVLGFPGAHLLVIVAVTAFIALTFAKRRHRLFTPKESWVLFSVSALYLLVLDGVLAASYVTAVGIGG